MFELPLDTQTYVVRNNVDDYVVKISESKRCIVSISRSYRGNIVSDFCLMIHRRTLYIESLTYIDYFDCSVDFLYESLYETALQLIRNPLEDHYRRDDIVTGLSFTMYTLMYKVFIQGEACIQEIVDYLNYINLQHTSI